MNHVRNGIIQMLLRQIIRHVMLYQNLQLMLRNSPLCVRNYTCTNLAFLAHKGFDASPIACCQCFGSFIRQLIENGKRNRLYPRKAL